MPKVPHKNVKHPQNSLNLLDFEEFLWAKGYGKEDIQKYTEGLDKSKVLAVYEHVPAQLAKENKKFQYSDMEALMKQGLPLVYYKKENSTLEEDFFVRTFENLVPVEVKSTNANSKSLRMLINGEQYSDIKYGIKLVKGNIGMNNDIYTFPYYTAFLIKRYLKACSK